VERSAGVEKRRKVGDRDALIDQLWSSIETLPDPEPQLGPKRPSKQDVVIAMLRQPEDATVDEQTDKGPTTTTPAEIGRFLSSFMITAPIGSCQAERHQRYA
jgi:hypothetical protein